MGAALQQGRPEAVRRRDAAAGPILAVRVADLDDKDVVLAARLDGFFTIPHFDGYAAVLVQLDTAAEADLREAIVDAWVACAPLRLSAPYREG